MSRIQKFIAADNSTLKVAHDTEVLGYRVDHTGGEHDVIVSNWLSHLIE